jgi:dTDP-4-amino-4,6-dideoxygalactose transaminase
LILVSDSAQSPLATDDEGNLTSTLCHIGGFSLNYHKHIHVGEGGVVVTSDDNLAERVRMLRNHGEVAVGFGNDFQKSQRGILGMNLRLGEIEAAIGRVQLAKVQQAVTSRREAGLLLTNSLSGLTGLKTVHIPYNYKHSFYVSGFILDYVENDQLPSRETLLLALTAEGVPALMAGYQNIHKLPLFANHLAIGERAWPYSLLDKMRREELRSSRLPIAESYHNKLFFAMNFCAHNYDEKEINLITKAFLKVWENLDSLKQ